MNRFSTGAFAIAVAGAIATPAAAAYQNIWSTDFDGGNVFQNTGPFSFSSASLSVGSGITFLPNLNGPASLGTDYLSNGTSATTTFNVGGLGAHDSIKLSFDLLFVDSWDSIDGVSCCSPDYLYVDYDGMTDAYTTAIASGSFNYFGPGVETAFGYFVRSGSWQDRIVHYDLTFAHSASSFTFALYAGGPGFQYGDDESWGIDNFALSANAVVPEPASWAMLIAGFGMVGATLRRRQVVATV